MFYIYIYVNSEQWKNRIDCISGSKCSFCVQVEHRRKSSLSFSPLSYPFLSHLFSPLSLSLLSLPLSLPLSLLSISLYLFLSPSISLSFSPLSPLLFPLSPSLPLSLYLSLSLSLNLSPFLYLSLARSPVSVCLPAIYLPLFFTQKK